MPSTRRTAIDLAARMAELEARVAKLERGKKPAESDAEPKPKRRRATARGTGQ